MDECYALIARDVEKAVIGGLGARTRVEMVIVEVVVDGYGCDGRPRCMGEFAVNSEEAFAD